MLYASNYIIFWKKENYGENKKISGFQGLQRKGMNRDQRNFRAIELLLKLS
jgi:hypothetical protein